MNFSFHLATNLALLALHQTSRNLPEQTLAGGEHKFSENIKKTMHEIMSINVIHQLWLLYAKKYSIIHSAIKNKSIISHIYPIESGMPWKNQYSKGK